MYKNIDISDPLIQITWLFPCICFYLWPFFLPKCMVNCIDKVKRKWLQNLLGLTIVVPIWILGGYLIIVLVFFVVNMLPYLLQLLLGIILTFTLFPYLGHRIELLEHPNKPPEI